MLFASFSELNNFLVTLPLLERFLVVGSVISTLYLFGTLVNLFRNRLYFLPLKEMNVVEISPLKEGISLVDDSPATAGPPSYKDQTSVNTSIFLSICIPARNESERIQPLLDSLSKIKANGVEILVLDDASTDNTRDVLERYAPRFKMPFRMLSGSERPQGWLGKPWACHQLSLKAHGRILLFLDADVIVSQRFIEDVKDHFNYSGQGLLTLWPIQILGSFWEKAVIPLVYYALLTLLPIVYQRRAPRWMPDFLYDRYKHIFAAACGQCIAITREAYDAVGGHEGVKSAVVEDVALAKLVRQSGFRVSMGSGHEAIQCRMYTSNSEMFSGFKKNFFDGFERNIPLFTFMGILHLVVFILPFFTLMYAAVSGSFLLGVLSLLPITLAATSRLFLNFWMGWPQWTVLLHPAGVLWFQWLSIRIGIDQLTGKKTSWKGRPVS